MTKGQILIERQHRREEIRRDVFMTIFVVIVICSSIIGSIIADHKEEVIASENQYPMLVTCIDIIDEHNDKCMFVNTRGKKYVFEIDDVSLGDMFSVIMNNNGTEDVNDDTYVENSARFEY